MTNVQLDADRSHDLIDRKLIETSMIDRALEVFARGTVGAHGHHVV